MRDALLFQFVSSKVSHDAALEHAETEFERYEIKRRRITASQPTSNFDQIVEQTKQLEHRSPAKPRGAKRKPSKKPRKKKRGTNGT